MTPEQYSQSILDNMSPYERAMLTVGATHSAIPERPEWMRQLSNFTQNNAIGNLFGGATGEMLDNWYWDQKAAPETLVMAGLEAPFQGLFSKAAAPVVAGGAGLLGLMGRQVDDSLMSPLAKHGKQAGAIGDRTVLKGADLPNYDDSFGATAQKQKKRISDEFTLITKDTVDKTESPVKSIADYEGYPFVTSMADRTAAGDEIVSLNGVRFKMPVQRTGGQDHMKYGNQLWASATGAVSNIYNVADDAYAKYGKHPIFIPFMMGGAGSHFSRMPAKTAVEYVRSGGMNAKQLADLDAKIRKVVPQFNIYRNPQGQIEKLSNSDMSAIEKLIHQAQIADSGGLHYADQRLAVSDLNQMDRPQGSIVNAGILDTYYRPELSGGTNNTAYPSGLWGQFDAAVAPMEANVFDLLTNFTENFGIDPRNLRQKTSGGGIKPTDPLYHLRQSGAQKGFIDHDLLMDLERKGLLGV